MTDDEREYPVPQEGTQNPGAAEGPPVATDREVEGRVSEHGRANG